MDENMWIQRGRGMVDMIAGKIPTLSGWTVNPTDAADITDGDITTFCTTGNKVAPGAYQYGYFEWDLGALYNIAIDLTGRANVTAGTSRFRYQSWDGAGWVENHEYSSSATDEHIIGGGRCSKVRIALGSNAAATTTPNIREFHVWRLQ